MKRIIGALLAASLALAACQPDRPAGRVGPAETASPATETIIVTTTPPVPVTNPPPATNPAPVTTTKTTTTKTTQSTQPPIQGVHPGAFCSEHYQYGYTVNGVLMRCITTATDSRFRWRAV